MIPSEAPKGQLVLCQTDDGRTLHYSLPASLAYVHELVQRERGLLMEPTNSLNNVERTSGGAA
jgi:hypothetical protein